MITELSVPWPLANRIFIAFRYLWEKPESEEFIMIFTGDGHEALWDKFTSKQDVSKFVVGKSFISAHWFTPLKNEKGETIGT